MRRTLERDDAEPRSENRSKTMSNGAMNEERRLELE